MGPRAPAKVQGGNGLGSKFEKPKPQTEPAGVRILIHEPVLLQHHGEPMDGALVKFHLRAEIHQTALSVTIPKYLQGRQGALKHLYPIGRPACGRLRHACHIMRWRSIVKEKSMRLKDQSNNSP